MLNLLACVGLLIAAALARPASADIAASASISVGSIYLGESAHFQITVTGAATQPAAQFPDVDGLNVTFTGVTHSTSQSISIVGNQMTQSSSTTFHMNYVLSPKRGGTFSIPEIAVTADGQTARTQPVTLTAIEPNADERAWIEVDVAPNPVTIGEEFKVVFKLFLRKLVYQNQALENDPYHPRNPPALEIPWFESLPNTETKEFRAFISGYVGSPGFTINQYARDEFFSRRLITFKLPRQSVVKNGKPYFVYSIEKTFKAVKTGPVDVGACTLKGSILDQVVSPNEATQQSVYQVSKPVALRISDPPESNRPAEWTGAIGRYDIRAAADPTRLNLGDPVTLTVTLRGDGLWSTVDAPDLTRQEEFRAFKIHDRDVPGEQTAEGKIFRLTVRPAQPDLKAIPPVRYAFYDPARKSYIVVKTQAIPIEIRATETVRLDEVIEARPDAPPAEIREVIEGLYANQTDPEIVLSTQDAGSGLGAGAALLTTPAIFLLAASVSAARARRDPARRRAAKAIGRLEKALRALADAAAPERLPSDFMDAVAAYVKDRLTLAETALTPADIDHHLERQGVPLPLRLELRQTLDHFERAKFSSMAISVDRKEICERMIALAREIDQHLRNHKT
ncbi:MAG: hypothetical protein A3G34_08570 [Candidatus Lindowbacteria bacterium RIFCSPLOWO2_12_FULL_62_27]|nr:MAG: hypothetical protein A3G34_08570 [Candidatus Lindowbacteria bacterium RIFCSPLOWO2_12_FULL_62_27]